jgi:hypothetical protein
MNGPLGPNPGCHEYQLLKQGYESALREGGLYERGGATSMQQANRYEGEAKAVSAAARNRLAAHSEGARFVGRTGNNGTSLRLTYLSLDCRLGRYVA